MPFAQSLFRTTSLQSANVCLTPALRLTSANTDARDVSVSSSAQSELWTSTSPPQVKVGEPLIVYVWSSISRRVILITVCTARRVTHPSFRPESLGEKTRSRPYPPPLRTLTPNSLRAKLGSSQTSVSPTQVYSPPSSPGLASLCLGSPREHFIPRTASSHGSAAISQSRSTDEPFKRSPRSCDWTH